MAIVGGGCAGLSLAHRLAASDLRVVVIEPRERYVADRTWSFWRTRPDPFQHCVVGSWSRWTVSAGGRTVVRGSARLRYETVCAGRFYDACLDRIRGADNIDLRLGTQALDIAETKNAVEIETGRGLLRATRAIDTRPLPGAPRYGQYFVGVEVRTAASVFDPDAVELMSFDAPRHDRIDFGYVLPFATDRALVEATAFGAASPRRGELEATLDRLLEERLGGVGRKVIRREAGMIPMDGGHVDRPASKRIASLGLRGGASRPSTGYSFVRIQQMADATAAALTRGAPPTPPRLDDAATRGMDRLFLKVLRREPGRGPELFARLFENAPQDRLERFLSGSGGWRDRLAVIAALPPGPFLAALVGR